MRQVAPVQNLLRVTLVAIFSLPLTVRAQDSGENAAGAFQAATNAIVALVSDNSLSAGRYKFKDDTSPDADLDLIKVRGEVPLVSDDAQYVPYIEIAPGYLDASQSSSGQGSLDIYSWNIGLGAGLEMKFLGGELILVPAFKFEYSDVDYDFKPPTGLSGNDNLPDINAMSYIPSLQIRYEPVLGENGQRILLSSRISYLYINGASSSPILDDFSDDSWISKNAFRLEIPIEDIEALGKVLFRPGMARVDMHGAARDGFGFNNFYEYGLEAASNSILDSYFSEVGFELVYLYESEVQGWRFGFFGDF